MGLKLKKQILYEVYKYLKKKDYKNFKADLENMELPKKIVEEQSGNIYQPDMIAQRNGITSVFEIETGKEIEFNKVNFIQKCKAFNQFAKKYEGKFYLIVPIQIFDTIVSEINNNYLENVGILQL